MKKLNYLLLALLLSIGITSCSSDSDDSGNNFEEASIVGTWEIVGFEVEDATTTTTINGEGSSSSFFQTGSNFDFISTFSEEPNILSGQGSYDLTTTITDIQTIPESDIEFEPTTTTNTLSTIGLSEDLTTSTWEIRNGDQLITTNANGLTATATIVELTDDTLVYVSDLSEATPLSFEDASEVLDLDFGGFDFESFFEDFDIETSTSGEVTITLMRVTE